MSQLKAKILTSFRNHGISLQGDAWRRLEAHLKEYPQAEQLDVAKSIIEKIDISKCRAIYEPFSHFAVQDGRLDVVSLERILEATTETNSSVPSNLFCSCLSALEVPKFVYNSTSKSFEER